MEQLGDYTITKKLGQGVFGDVYLAEHRFIKRSFALKVIPEEISTNPIFMRKFESEVSEITALDHPNIAKIHNISSCDDLFFIVMDPHVDSLDETMNLERYLELKGKLFMKRIGLTFLNKLAQPLTMPMKPTWFMED